MRHALVHGKFWALSAAIMSATLMMLGITLLPRQMHPLVTLQGRDVSRSSILGDGYIDQGWKNVWSSIPAQYKQVTKELSGYNLFGPNGRQSGHSKAATTAKSELASYSSILGHLGSDGDSGQSGSSGSGRHEVKEYDKELASYSNILSFPPADPDKAAESIRIAKPKAKVDETKRIASIERKLRKVDRELAEDSQQGVQGGAEAGAGSRSKSSKESQEVCNSCLRHWDQQALSCAKESCSPKMWESELAREQVKLNNQLASVFDSCVPASIPSSKAKILVSSFVLPWDKPFSPPDNSWLKIVPTGPGYDDLGLRTGETPQLKLSGYTVLSGADLKCKGGKTMEEQLEPLVERQSVLNRKRAFSYFEKLSNSPKGAEAMAEKALESANVRSAVMSWLYPVGEEDAQKRAMRQREVAAREEEEKKEKEAVERKKEKMLEERRKMEALKVKELEKRVMKEQEQNAQGGGYLGLSHHSSLGFKEASADTETQKEEEKSAKGSGAVQNAMIRMLKAKEALLQAIRRRAMEAKQAGRHGKVSSKQLATDEKAFEDMQHHDRSIVKSASYAQQRIREEQVLKLQKLRHERLERERMSLRSTLKKLKSQMAED
uniref:Uncharacterized protein n=1 Tax=Hanusia phi TaxID=3032 RepID=A0A7S0NF49_9CRYP|mmetsp:Transcript_8923/g.20383  ORF Transcript_8923/g.20383 Transcript_8923/m.20383 type:complete len:606 (+) Transcript_8923:213-2030(+)